MSYKQRYRLARSHGYTSKQAKAYAKRGTKIYGIKRHRKHRRYR